MGQTVSGFMLRHNNSLKQTPAALKKEGKNENTFKVNQSIRFPFFSAGLDFGFR
jgi:hypothetical protein